MVARLTMAGAFLSADWYRVAALCPRVRRQVDFHRQVFRGRVWHVVQDHQSGAFNRLTAQGHYLFGRMDGRHSIETLWQDACQRFPDDPPSQSDVIHLLSQLYQADLITTDNTPDMDELATRAKRQARRQWTSRVSNPLAMRLPLFDPDPFLRRTAWIVAPVFTPLAAGLWLCLMAAAIWLAATNWQDLVVTAGDTALLGSNLLMMSLIYPLIKLLHELGHGYATRHWGGEVREVGFLFLLFVPVPYVDASQSLAFASKWRRAGVASAGIVVELTLAALALIFWLNAEPGLAREAAFNVLLIGSVSTLLFNGNPLLRFDGYFILSDMIEIPNLGIQANRYFWHLVQRHLLKIRHQADPPRDLGERLWLLGYAVVSCVYRTLIVVVIAIYLADQFGTVGLLLAIFALCAALVWPLLKGGWFLVQSPLLARLRQRAVLISLGAVSLSLLVLFALPVPYVTVATGVFLPDARSILRADAEGFVAEILVRPGESVDAGQPLLRLEDPTLNSRIEVASSEVRQLELEVAAVRMTDRVQALMLEQQLLYARERLADLQGIGARLTLNSPAAGQVHLPGDSADLPGRLVRKGEALGYVWPVAAPVLRVAVHQAEAELVRTRTVGVDFVLKRDIRHRASARISAWVPDSTIDLPSKALSTDADGEIVPDPADPSGMKALQSLYLFEVTPDRPVSQPLIGERALVRFDHGAEPYGWRILRALRQVFLRRLDP